MAAADNPYYISPANPLQALMSGVQGYDTAQKQTKQNQMEQGRKNAMLALQNGGDLKNPLAELIGIGDVDGAKAISTFAEHQANRQFRETEADRAQSNADRSFGLQKQTLDEGKVSVQHVEDPITGSSKLVRIRPNAPPEVIWDSMTAGRAQPAAPQATPPQAVQPPPMAPADARVGPPTIQNKDQSAVPALPPGAPMGGAPVQAPQQDSAIPSTARQTGSNPQNEEYLQQLQNQYGVDTANLVRKIANYEVSPLTLSTKGGHREQLLKMVSTFDPTYEQTTYPTIQNTRNEYAKGKGSATVRSLNVAIDHLNTYEELAGALKNGNVQVINSIKNKFQTQFGATAPANLEAAKQIIGAEIVKAIVGAGGGVGERQDAAKAIDAAKTPDQFQGVIATYKKLLAGQLEGHRRQYETNAKRGDFDKFLSEDVLKLMRHIREDTGSKTEGTTTGGIKWKVVQ